jgi:hypothetical protein
VVLDLPWSATTRISDLVQRLEAVSVDAQWAISARFPPCRSTGGR